MRSTAALFSLIILSLQFLLPGSSQVYAETAQTSGDTHPVYLPLVYGPQAVSALTATYRSGQTFLTWDERSDMQGETYRVYRSTQAITAANLSGATLLATVGKNSARFYANRYVSGTATWKPRYVDRYVITDGGAQLPAGKGLLVWTLNASDLGGAISGAGYYAVTVTPPGGAETLENKNAIGPISEAVAEPQPVEITTTPGVSVGSGGHVYIQFMDLRNWNPTFHAPNATNAYYGLPASAEGIANALQYAYDYVVFVPSKSTCGGSLPSKLPVIVHLHDYRANTSAAKGSYPDPYCAYGVYPIDVSNTWFFGFAQHQDYRLPGEVKSGDTIVNYTEQRILRMVYDLELVPPSSAVNSQRIYVDGQGMGGSGALAFAERYANVFAAAYASQPFTNLMTAGTTDRDWEADASVRWGKPGLNLPVSIGAPNGWAASIADKYDGVGVWDWQNYKANAAANHSNSTNEFLEERVGDDMAPVSIAMSKDDGTVSWDTQGNDAYAAFEEGRRSWSGIITDSGHQWEDYEGLMPALSIQGSPSAPFWKLKVNRDESVPGLSSLSGNTSAEPGGHYNQTMIWSSSWNDWDGAPVDTTSKWRISLCSVPLSTTTCDGTGLDQTVNVTPRRLQNFVIKPNKEYHWSNYSISAGETIESGTVSSNGQGVITIKDFKVSPKGNRLTIVP